MDKREIAANLILRAVKSYVNAQNDMDYIQAILLAGSSVGITEPLLREQQTKTATEKSIDVIMKMRASDIFWEGSKLVINQNTKTLSRRERDDISKRTRIFDRGIYNSLKHTGKPKQDLSPSDDVIIEADFQNEAEEIIYDAVHDFNSLKFDENFQYHQLPEEIILLLNCGDPMGIIPDPVAKQRTHS
ncbi:hypothetical protein H5202_08385 [Shewanella sp. SG41-4]|uniref:hypothetical protein n=1 Tax=Shewanella sp. SG41-4 TaxID=2760976 RepID=UPI0015FF04D9|nr:hypothetical protein [Shewanella sp. SG41-4]MBB1438698.1 hypothetical protein [Shewanella sp. SG41-4]